MPFGFHYLNSAIWNYLTQIMPFGVHYLNNNNNGPLLGPGPK